MLTSATARRGTGSGAFAWPAPLNPFAMGIPFLLIGAVLTVIFPPVGVALLALGTITCLAGVVMAIAASRVLDAGAQGAAASINQNVGGAVGGK